MATLAQHTPGRRGEQRSPKEKPGAGKIVLRFACPMKMPALTQSEAQAGHLNSCAAHALWSRRSRSADDVNATPREVLVPAMPSRMK